MTNKQFKEYCENRKKPEKLIDFKCAFDKSKVPTTTLQPFPKQKSNVKVRS